MKGMGATYAPVGTDKSTSSPEQPVSRVQPRGPIRGFFAQFQREGSPDNENIVWSLPPLLPFDCEDPNENSGFVALAKD